MATLAARISDLAAAIRDKINLMVPRLLPSGGTAGQFLVKNSSTNYDAAWVSPDWTYVVLASDWATSSTTLANATGLAFTPQPNKTYIIEFVGSCRQASGGWGWSVGMAFPTAGIIDSSAYVQFGNASNSNNFSYQNAIGGTVSAITYYTENASASWLARANAMITTGPSVTGQVRMQLASNGPYSITFKKGSFIRYRVVS